MSTDPANLPLPAPDLKTDTVRVGSAVVCVLSGDVHLGTRAIGDDALSRALELRPALLAVDLDAVELFTADGLNLLLAVREAADEQGVTLVLLSPGDAVREVLDATGAAGMFEIHPTLAEATARHRR
ncbi:STAS domain-containing protein [Streptomyces racemochromogenes]|uniref:STAS domain-containing protein n=1 Tax=Streptomyces racemochromogenes TaxID=67353 RepID=UPI0031E8885F